MTKPKRFESTLKLGSVRPSARPPPLPTFDRSPGPSSPPSSRTDEDTALIPPISAESHVDPTTGIELDVGTGIEIVLVRERPRAHSETWRAFEIWTKNRIYGLDMSMKCFIVLDRKSGSVERTSPAKGYRLGGGRLKTEAGTRVSYPFPVVGTEAMLTDGKKRVHTSRVERFLIRIRELHMRTEEEALRWEDVENS